MSNTSILVADTCCARFLAADKAGLLQEARPLSDRLARLSGGDQASDSSGRANGSSGSSHGLGNADSVKAGTAKTPERVPARLQERL
jgi:hypothetical protein